MVTTTAVVTVFNRVEFVRRVLIALSHQSHPVDEVVLTDDGSDRDVPGSLADLLPDLRFGLTYVRQEHRGFRAGKCRNNGVRVARGDYLVFLDQDILFSRGYVETFVRERASREFLVGYPVRLTAGQTEALTWDMVRAGDYSPLVSGAQLAVVRRQWRKDRLYRLLFALRLRRIGPKLRSGVCGMWKEDFVAVNGFDEEYQGWGNEDDDLGARLHRAGVGGRNPFRREFPVHLYHLPHQPGGIRANREYYRRRKREIRRGALRCRWGLQSPLGEECPEVRVLK